MQISFNSSQPIYEQIIAQIKKKIARGELKSGDKLPSQRQLAKELEVNPNTVQRAYREMEIRKLVETKRGRGTFIYNDQQVINKVIDEMTNKALENFFNELNSLGFDSSDIVKKVKDYAKNRGDNNEG
jgi:GntR family transcriptional regulator